MTSQAETFTKENLQKDGCYVVFYSAGASRTIARFKYGQGGIGPFMTFLRKNFTPAEYFARADAGEAPLKIAESKGFLLPHVKRTLREAGYPETTEGFSQYIRALVEARA